MNGILRVVLGVVLGGSMLSSNVRAEAPVQTEAPPRPEYPRPDFARERWLNLNGTWEFRYDPDGLGDAGGWSAPGVEGYDETIVVPFPWQSTLSGQAKVDYAGIAWYRRTFEVPGEWAGERIFLRFGAVDYFASVWVNGQLQGTHEGGYTPFEFDVTDALQPGTNTVVVRAEDPADLRDIPHGKQRSVPPDPWNDVSFTTTGGIWQTVWLEPRPAAHIQGAWFTPDVPGERVSLRAAVFSREAGQAELRLSLQPPGGGAPIETTLPITLTAAGVTTVTAEIAIPQPVLWDIGQPNLYNTTLTLSVGDARDEITTYFGMRSIEARDGQVWLNGRPIYMMTALDQGFWPDGIHTAPSDEALRWDIEYALQLGLNGLRKHIKIEDPRYYYWADQLGLLIWCDAPSPTNFNETTRRRLRNDLEAMVARDYNHPSIVIWSPYNETWGLEFRLDTDREMQAWVIELYDTLKAWDPTRLVVDNSGWSHVKTDIADFHYYTGDRAEWRGINTILANRPDQATVLGHPFYSNGYRWQGEPLMMSEYGAGWRDDRSWWFLWQTSEIRRHGPIVGYTYTEHYDVEREYAGFATYDRRPKDFGFDPALGNDEDFVVLDYTRDRTLAPGETVTVTPYVSAYGRPPLTAGTLRWRLVRVTEPEQVVTEGEVPLAVTAYTVTQQADLTIALPAEAGPVQLWAEVIDEAGDVRARNYLDFEVYAGAPPREERQGERFVLRVDPNRQTEQAWDAGFVVEGQPVFGEFQAVSGRGTGFFEYRLPLPAEAGGAFTGLHFAFEGGAHIPEIIQSLEGQDRPTDLVVSVNGVEIGSRTLGEVRVNANGALSHLNRFGPGTHGEWLRFAAPDERLAEIEAAARAAGEFVVRLAVPEGAEHANGLWVFGDRAGRYGQDPSLTLEVAGPAPTEALAPTPVTTTPDAQTPWGWFVAAIGLGLAGLAFWGWRRRAS